MIKIIDVHHKHMNNKILLDELLHNGNKGTELA